MVCPWLELPFKFVALSGRSTRMDSPGEILSLKMFFSQNGSIPIPVVFHLRPSVYFRHGSLRECLRAFVL